MSGIDSAWDEKWSEWIDWGGGECPVKGGTFIQWKGRHAVKSGSPVVNAASVYWEHRGDPMDVIAYRYKIKEQESDMHPDLERCAHHEWNEKFDRITWNHAVSGPEWFNQKYFTGKDGYTRSEHSVARQQLGIDQPEVTDAEEEAWRAKERELIGGPRKAESFLHQAADLMAERGKQYDQPGGERSMGKAVAALNAITGRDLTEAEGWLLMSLVKRVRQHTGAGYHQDSAEDAVAYAALEAEALESAN